MGIDILVGVLRKPAAPHQVGGPSSAVGQSRIGWLTSVNRRESSIRLPRVFAFTIGYTGLLGLLTPNADLGSMCPPPNYMD